MFLDNEPLARHVEVRLLAKDSLTTIAIELLRAGDIGRDMVSAETIYQCVLFLELLQSLGVVGLHAAVLIPPAVPGRLGDLELPAVLGHVVALVEQPLAFGELSHRPFGSVMPLFHAVLLAPFWSIWTRTTSPDHSREVG